MGGIEMYQVRSKRLSALSIVSMVGAILFAVAAFCMVFLPLVSASASYTSGLDSNQPLSAQKTQSVLDASAIGSDGSAFLETYSQWPETKRTFYDEYTRLQVTSSGYSKERMDAYKRMCQEMDKLMPVYHAEVVLATVVFFAMLLLMLGVIAGKALHYFKGGRIAALVCSSVGVVVSIGFLLYSVFWLTRVQQFMDFMQSYYMTSSSAKYTSSMEVGAGAALMAVFAVATFIFCCIGFSGSAAYTHRRPPYEGGYPSAGYQYGDGFYAGQAVPRNYPYPPQNPNPGQPYGADPYAQPPYGQQPPRGQ